MAPSYHTPGGHPNMEMILLDWTRMAATYCVAGAITQNGQMRVVRPLWVRHRQLPVRNVGWTPFVMDGHSRWEIFELVGPEPAVSQPPHCEDIWVRDLRPTRRLANSGQRRAILESTLACPTRPLFGSPLTPTASSAYLAPGAGERSLTTIVLTADHVQFLATLRPHTADEDLRVRLNAPGFEGRLLKLKDHFLLLQAEQASANLEGQLKCVQEAVRKMGNQVAVRVGLSRPYTPPGGEPGCWLMADGFFSFDEPMP
jgi:hypothetical protein